MPQRTVRVPPGGFQGLQQQTAATQALFGKAMRTGTRTKKRRKKVAKKTARKATRKKATKKRTTTKRRSTRGRLKKGSPAAKKRMKQLRAMQRKR